MSEPIEDYLATLPKHREDGLFTAGITDREQTTVSITRPGHEFGDAITELEWVGTSGDFREAEERLPSDRADAERLMERIESQLPEGYLDAESVTIELTEDELDRLHVLVGIV